MKPHTTRDIIDTLNPGTPDAEVCIVRRRGREAARQGLPDTECPYEHTGSLSNNRLQWMLGYYDVGLERFLLAPDAGLSCKQEGVR
jgi:hypothetical protein